MCPFISLSESSVPHHHVACLHAHRRHASCLLRALCSVLPTCFACMTSRHQAVAAVAATRHSSQWHQCPPTCCSACACCEVSPLCGCRRCGCCLGSHGQRWEPMCRPSSLTCKPQQWCGGEENTKKHIYCMTYYSTHACLLTAEVM